MAIQPPLRIIFMGTPEFAVTILDTLLKANKSIVAVVTAPDKPAGRGLKMGQSKVKEYALLHQLPLLQPNNLKDPAFTQALKNLEADLQIVVAFRMLPEIVWNMPRLGSINLHASLLPDYRGAAPINWAIINGEHTSGVSTFFLTKEIDEGKIIVQEKVPIEPTENAGSYHDKLMHIGAQLVIKTVEMIEKGLCQPVDQANLMPPGRQLHPAPKITKETGAIDWTKPVKEIYNLIRGLSPYPGCHTRLLSPSGHTIDIKIFQAELVEEMSTIDKLPYLETDGKSYLSVVCAEGKLKLIDVQLAGRKRMPIGNLLNGFPMDVNWTITK